MAAIDTNHGLRATRARRQSLSDENSRPLLRVERDRVLEVEDQRVGARRARPLELARLGSRHEEQGAAQVGAGGELA